VPPRQHAPWAAPSLPRRPANAANGQPQPNALPAKLITSIGVLFDQGLADPRGCEYWEVGITVGSVWGGAGIVQTHAFVLPPKPSAAGATTTQPATRFAVCWNGLVYPVQSVGKRADVAADVRALLRADQEERAHPYTHPDFLLNASGAVSEWDSVSYRSLLALKGCMLLRLGEISLATEFWKPQPGPPANNNNNVADRDPYLGLAEEWTGAMFDRAVCAHMRGDDRLALLTARQLVPAAQAVEAMAEKRGFERPRPVNDQDRDKKMPYLRFLEPAPRLLADEERRVRQGNVERVVGAPAGRFPDRAGRIAALVRDLEEVAARQWGQPGGVSLDGDPVIEAIAKEGNDAVDPLLACLEADRRLTRSVSFGRDFSLYRHLSAWTKPLTPPLRRFSKWIRSARSPSSGITRKGTWTKRRLPRRSVPFGKRRAAGRWRNGGMRCSQTTVRRRSSGSRLQDGSCSRCP
jgi:hypothetical protein